MGVHVCLDGKVFYDSEVSARDLHKLLEIEEPFYDWFKGHVKMLGLEEGVHYTKVAYKDRHKYDFLQPLKSKKDYSTIEYIISFRVVGMLLNASTSPNLLKVKEMFEITNPVFQGAFKSPPLESDMLDKIEARVEPDMLDEIEARVKGLESEVEGLESEVRHLKEAFVKSNNVHTTNEPVNSHEYDFVKNVLMMKDVVYPSLIASNYIKPDGRSLSATMLNKYLYKKGIIYCKGRIEKRDWHLYQKYQDMGWGCRLPELGNKKKKQVNPEGQLLFTLVGFNAIDAMLQSDGYMRMKDWVDLKKAEMIKREPLKSFSGVQMQLVKK